MNTSSIPILSLRTDRDELAARLGDSFREFGFAVIRDHGIDPELIDHAWRMTRAFFALPEAERRSYHRPELAGARGYTPFRTEIARDAAVHDLKEFWHIGRDLPPGHQLAAKMPKNIWPQRPEGFREIFTSLFMQFDRVGSEIMSHVAPGLGLDRNWFEPAMAEGNSVLRLLHYPPLADDPGDALRAGPHEDINLITLLLGAEEAGLELLGQDSRWIAVSPPEGALVVNIGDMLQRLTNHVLPSTTHRVGNPDKNRAGASRYSMPFFVHLRSDFRLHTLPRCVTTANPDRYPDPITADDYLQERLREIGLRA